MGKKYSFMRYITKVERVAPTCTRYYVGEDFMVELTVTFVDRDSTTDLMSHWVKAKLLPKRLPTYISVTTYFTDTDGNCYGKYNPQIGKSRSLDFNWVLEANAENTTRIVNECIRRWHAAMVKKERQGAKAHVYST